MGNNGIYIAVVGGNSRRRLFAGAADQIARSPDGLRIAASYAGPPPGEIYVFSLSSRKRTNVSHTNGTDDAPAWSPDGRRIAWPHDDQIWLANADGSVKRRLTHPAKRQGDGGPTWSPDGRWIVFGRAETVPETCRLYLVRTRGGAPRPLFPVQADQPPGLVACDRGAVWFR